MPDDPVVPLDPDRLDAIQAEHQPNAPQSAEDIYALCAGCGLPWPCDVLALVAAARERDALRAEVERLLERQVPDGWRVLVNDCPFPTCTIDHGAGVGREKPQLVPDLSTEGAPDE